MLDRINEITGGDPTRTKVYVDMFHGASSEAIKSVEDAAGRSDHAAIRASVHGLKPLMKTLGFDSIWDTANAIEVSIDEGQDLDQVPIKCTLLIEQLRTAIESLDA